MWYIVVAMTSANDDIGTLREQLTLRLSRRDVRRLKTLKKRIPIASNNAIAREALRLGLEALERDPSHILREKREESE
jgi:hypothetical protein